MIKNNLGRFFFIAWNSCALSRNAWYTAQQPALLKCFCRSKCIDVIPSKLFWKIVFSWRKRLSHCITHEYLFIVSTTEYTSVVNSIQKLVLPPLDLVDNCVFLSFLLIWHKNVLFLDHLFVESALLILHLGS